MQDLQPYAQIKLLLRIQFRERGIEVTLVFLSTMFRLKEQNVSRCEIGNTQFVSSNSSRSWHSDRSITFVGPDFRRSSLHHHVNTPVTSGNVSSRPVILFNNAGVASSSGEPTAIGSLSRKSKASTA